MSKEERHKQHLRHGLILSSHSESTNGNGIVNDLFFTSVMQMNLGGPEIVQDPEQKILVSRFNLKAGKLLIAHQITLPHLRSFNMGYRIWETIVGQRIIN